MATWIYSYLVTSHSLPVPSLSINTLSYLPHPPPLSPPLSRRWRGISSTLFSATTFVHITSPSFHSNLIIHRISYSCVKQPRNNTLYFSLSTHLPVTIVTMRCQSRYKKLSPQYVSDSLLVWYVRILSIGCPAKPVTPPRNNTEERRPQVTGVSKSKH